MTCVGQACVKMEQEAEIGHCPCEERLDEMLDEMLLERSQE